MIRILCSHVKWFLCFAAFLAVSEVGHAQASVETYVDDALPPSSGVVTGQPLSAGDMTMQDIVRSTALTKKKAAATGDNPLALSPATAAAMKPNAAVPTPTQAPSSAGAMLLQGMQSALGVPAANPVAPMMAMPKSLPSADKTSASGPCTPQVTGWVKSCAEAGYPETYVGQIRGETRTTCPQGNLQDVWISNGCTPPDNAQAAATSAPLTGPSASAAAETATVPSSSTEHQDASCGVANGLAALTQPIYDLCSAGTPSAVNGNGPWRWNCQGVAGGMTVSCAAPVAQAPAQQQAAQPTTTAPKMEDALCGSADGTITDTAPNDGLCAKGMASHVNGAGPWTWACSGMNGGRAAACSAQKKTDGKCGDANGSGTDQMPMSDLCTAGYASAVTGNGPWSWTCSGLNGGQAATCSAAPKLNAVCGPASLSGHNDAPKNALCSVGQPSAVSGYGPWNWTCAGTNGGASVSCEARKSENGVCGSAHGAAVTAAPEDGLCTTGKASRVTGNGPWSWTCAGSEGGDTASCTATRSTEHAATAAFTPPKQAAITASSDTANLCGSAAELVAIEAPSKNLCRTGTASSVTGHGPWSWTCSDNGQQSSCATLSMSASSNDAPAVPVPTMAPVDSQTPQCGSAAGQGASQEPSSDLCSVGKASSVSGRGPWTWTCSKGKARASCTAPKIADGICGEANGTTLRNVPTRGLCKDGAPTQVQGNGPWIWTCVGTGGGSSISCSAASQAQMRVDGICGNSANQTLSVSPAANLCDSGVASAVYGEGPWTWTCSGLNGGIAASCSAGKNTPPAPPPPGPAINGLCGAANGVAMIVQPLDNLCSTGTATAVSGSGPWNWGCLGENGGMTVSCTAPLQPPAPISGVCGPANGVPTLTVPKSGLCSGGISSAVSGKGPWTWSCSGVNGGSAVGCVAPLAGADIGSLPSMTTPSSPEEAPVPKAAPASSVTKHGLVTPRMPSGSLPPLQTGNLPPAPHPETVAIPMETPPAAEAQGITPPPVRDTIQPSPALMGDQTSALLPGNHFVLPEDVSTVPFAAGSDNYDSEVLPTLSKLADILNQNGGVRITLTAYADNHGTTPREARRLSLSRALALRDYLTSKGISSSRIDVRALGANIPSGEPDRVDIRAN